MVLRVKVFGGYFQGEGVVEEFVNQRYDVAASSYC